MKFFAKYVKNFDVLLVLFANKPVTKTTTTDNIELLYHGDELVGANIFNPSINKEKTYNLEDVVLQDYVQKTLAPIFKFETIQPQFIVVEVIKCEKISGTHLSLCKVTDGVKQRQIVCGASNVKTGLFTCLATVGAFMPNGMLIANGSLKGHASAGMLCSAAELKISTEKWLKPGIMELPKDKKLLGKSIWEVIC